MASETADKGETRLLSISAVIKKKKLTQGGGMMLPVVMAALFLTIIFVMTMDFGADDAQGYNWIYQRYELGERPDGGSLFNPMLALLSILHFLHIGVNGTWLCIMYYAVWYFGCVLITLSVSVRTAGANRWWLLMAAVFLLLPSTRTNRFHLIPTFMGLLILLLLIKYKEFGKRVYLILPVVIALYTMTAINDRALFLMFIPAPAVVCLIIWCIQDKKYHKYLYLSAALCTFAALAAKILDRVLIAVRGNGLAIFNSWGGYGGDDYAIWIDIGTLFDKAIPSFFSALLYQFNIPVQGGFIQALSFFWLIRIFMVGLCLAVCISNTREIVKKGIENVEMIDAASTVIVVVLTLINLLNGSGKYITGVDGWPINRYNSIAWFLLIVILIRWLDKKYIGVELNGILNRKILSERVLVLIFLCLTIGYAMITHKNVAGKLPCGAEIEFLEQRADDYHCGLASWWKAMPVTAQTNGEHVVCHGWITMDEADHDIWYLQCNNDYGNFTDGSNVFNYIISDMNNTMTLDEQNINSTRGDYIDKNAVGSSQIYLYDYDIRWSPRLIMEAVVEDYELTDAIEYYFDFPVGTNRVEMDVTNSGNFLLEVAGNEDVDGVTVTCVNDNKIYVDLLCRQNTNITFKVARKEEETTTIHKIVLKRVKGAVEVADDAFYLREGSYIVTINGDNLNHSLMVFEGEGIEVKRLTDGRIKNRYQLDVAVPQTIKFEVTGNGIVVDKIFYENTNLLDENSIDSEWVYYWNI